MRSHCSDLIAEPSRQSPEACQSWARRVFGQRKQQSKDLHGEGCTAQSGDLCFRKTSPTGAVLLPGLLSVPTSPPLPSVRKWRFCLEICKCAVTGKSLSGTASSCVWKACRCFSPTAGSKISQSMMKEQENFEVSA